MRLRYTRRALAQLEQILIYIEDKSPAAAGRVNRRIKQSIERLLLLPYSARSATTPGVRVLPVPQYPYLVFYKVDEAAREVIILRIRHQSRDPSKHLD